MNKETIELKFKEIQNSICQALQDADQSQFHEDLWSRPGGGGGRTRVVKEGNNIEKGGVNFSAVQGKTPEKIASALNINVSDFYATGVSIVIHPRNPNIPIIHMNIRYFEMDNGTWWFGGGIDLTPHMIDKKQAKFFHSNLKDVCDRYDSDFYTKFKKWADDYFYIKHRNETRGIGGVFFDRLNDQNSNLSKEELFEFVVSIGQAFAPTYIELFNQNKEKSFTERMKDWQYIRRSRYAEFNLVYDKGTKFGLDTDGRIESILMSMPPMATWIYDFTPNIQEQQTLDLLIKGNNWVS